MVVEVLSPGTARYDRNYKMKLYARCGVKEYWLADPANRSVEVYLLQDGVLAWSETYTLFYDWEMESMSEKEVAEIQHEFKTSLFDHWVITVADVFARMID